MRTLIGIVIILVSCVALGLLWYFFSHVPLNKEQKAEAVPGGETSQESPASSKDQKEAYDLKNDAQFLGVIAGTSVYLGTEKGTLERLPMLPEKTEPIALARGAQVLFVLTKDASGEHSIYERTANGYEKRYTAKDIQSITVSPYGTYLGFIAPVGGTSHAFALENGKSTPVDLGKGTALAYFVHEKTLGAWIVGTDGLMLVKRTPEGWTKGEIVKEGKGATDVLATNGASRFAFIEKGGAIKEYVITSLTPLTVQSLGSYNPIPHISLFFKKDRFYGFDEGKNAGSAYLVDLKNPEISTAYSIRGMVPGVKSISLLEP